MASNPISATRLRNQLLVGGQFDKAEKVVSWMGAMQGQDFSGAKWAIALRTKSLTDLDVQAAIKAKKIVRTWSQRGTLHLVPAKDIRWMIDLMTPKVVSGSKNRRESLGLTDQVFAKCVKIFEKTLAGSNGATRDELKSTLRQSKLNLDDHAIYHLFFTAAQRKVICFGPQRGKQDTFVLLDEWIPKSRKMSIEESLTEIVRRYFISHGPAQIQDFMWWSGLTSKETKAGIENLGNELQTVALGASTYYMSADSEIESKARSSLLLPGFDEYLLGYKYRGDVLDSSLAETIAPGRNGIFKPTIVIDGEVRGTWSVKRKAKELLIELLPFDSLRPAQRKAIIGFADRYSEHHAIAVTVN